MSSSVKNIIVILIAFTLVFAGYYFYAQNKSSVLAIPGGGVSDEMLANAQAFINHSITLGNINLQTDIFNNPVFRSYRSYSAPVDAVEQGRPNPFEEIGTDVEVVE